MKNNKERFVSCYKVLCIQFSMHVNGLNVKKFKDQSELDKHCKELNGKKEKAKEEKSKVD